VASNYLHCQACGRWSNHEELSYSDVTRSPNETERKWKARSAVAASDRRREFTEHCPNGFVRYRQCEQCDEIWQSIELPVDFVDGLVEAMTLYAEHSDEQEVKLKRLIAWADSPQALDLPVP
jgi:hypothetical protein